MTSFFILGDLFLLKKNLSFEYLIFKTSLVFWWLLVFERANVNLLSLLFGLFGSFNLS